VNSAGLCLSGAAVIEAAIGSTRTALIREPGFLQLWILGGLNSTGRWLEALIIAVFVLDMTGSPLLVAAMLMLRLLPMALFGAFGGVIAQRFARIAIMRLASLLIVASALLQAFAATAGALQVWHVALGSFLSGVAWSTDFPVRRTLMGDIAGPDRVSRAMSLDILAGAFTRTVGPLLGGYLYQRIGLPGAFLLAAMLYACGGLVLVFGRIPDPSDAAAQVSAHAGGASLFEGLRQGVRALKNSRTLPGIFVITLIFNLWAFPFFSMVPVYAREVLGLDAAGVGMLVSIEGAGALLGAAALALWAKSAHSRYLYVFGVLGYCLFALLIVQSKVFWLASALLLLAGMASAAFGAMQSALVLMNAPANFERQMMGLLSVVIGTAPIGFLHIGLLADWLGVVGACTLVAMEGLLAMAWALSRWPRLLSVQSMR